MRAALKEIFVYFQSKSDLQVNKIMKAVKSMDVKLDSKTSVLYNTQDPALTQT